MERRPHRDQRMILRYLTAFCPYCYPFPPLFFFPISLSRVWVANVHPAVVLFYYPALLVLLIILSPSSVLYRTTAPTNVTYIS